MSYETDRPKIKELEHPNTMVVCKKKSEIQRVLRWAHKQNKSINDFYYEIDTFPFCLSVHGPFVGWTNSMKRGFYYKPFNEFINDIATEEINS